MIRNFCFRAIGSPIVIYFVKGILLYTKCWCKKGSGTCNRCWRMSLQFGYIQMDSRLSQHFTFRLGVSGDPKHSQTYRCQRRTGRFYRSETSQENLQWWGRVALKTWVWIRGIFLGPSCSDAFSKKPLLHQIPSRQFIPWDGDCNGDLLFFLTSWDVG